MWRMCELQEYLVDLPEDKKKNADMRNRKSYNEKPENKLLSLNIWLSFARFCVHRSGLGAPVY